MTETQQDRLAKLAAEIEREAEGSRARHLRDVQPSIVLEDVPAVVAALRSACVPASACPNPADCCRELSRVWAALHITRYTGLSASEHVARLRAEISSDGVRGERGLYGLARTACPICHGDPNTVCPSCDGPDGTVKG